jgi:hypothetical protein
VSLVLCDGGINAIVKGSKFKESHVLENTKLRRRRRERRKGDKKREILAKTTKTPAS